MSSRETPRIPGRRIPGRRARARFWAVAGVATLAFLVALEIAARRYGLPGPMTNQAKELVFAPASGPLLYAGLALTMVVLTWRERFVAVSYTHL